MGASQSQQPSNNHHAEILAIDCLFHATTPKGADLQPLQLYLDQRAAGINDCVFLYDGFSAVHIAAAISVHVLQKLLKLFPDIDFNVATTQPLHTHDVSRLKHGLHFFRSRGDTLESDQQRSRPPYFNSSDTTNHLFTAPKWLMYHDHCQLRPEMVYKDIGWSPLMIALAFARHSKVHDIVDLLLLHGADASLSSTMRAYTPLMVAIRRREPQLIDTLLDAGASLTAENSMGESALLQASQIGFVAEDVLLQVLQQREQRVSVVMDAMHLQHKIPIELVDSVLSYLSLERSFDDLR